MAEQTLLSPTITHPPVTDIARIGEPKIDSPLKERMIKGGYKNSKTFITDQDRVVIDPLFQTLKKSMADGEEPLSFELAGPREKIYFDPKKLKCAIVTCGGLCPGINSVVRATVLDLYHNYGVVNILGIRYGFEGLIPKYGHEVIELTPKVIRDVHNAGGTFLSSSRGQQDVGEMVDALERLNIGLLFSIGGDGTLRATEKISEEITNRGLKISVIGIPKTIDNDINYLSKSFGFDTAVEVATQVIRSAHQEALGAPNGIGLVKLMGRYSGFIACNAALAQRDVNFCLIPEADFDLEGEHGFFAELQTRIEHSGHAVIVVAEGAGQKFFKQEELGKDASGNIKLGDIGVYLKDSINAYFKSRNFTVNLKYIDPSYTIRSVPANANDRIYCGFLGQLAVHAGMAGKTNMLIALWNDAYVHMPIKTVISERKCVNIKSRLWQSVLESTGQPPMINDVS
ncbi:MAG: ATP-dependent 6-phosphofructokinase [Deltaproteobacteria bacterium]|nr:ATP-dependent 6-phosphofructokinase [Deltaproteobacteria bacterium]